MFRVSTACIIAALLCPTLSYADPASECGVENNSQAQIANCLKDTAKRVDETIKQTLGFAVEAARSLDSTTGRKVVEPALEKAHAGWSAARDAQCEYVEATYAGGSGGSIANLSCRIKMGRERADLLLTFAD